MKRVAILNFTAINAKSLVAIGVSMAAASAITRSLGMTGYATSVALFSLAALLNTIVNPVVDLCTKDSAKLIHQGELNEVRPLLSGGIVFAIIASAVIYAFAVSILNGTAWLPNSNSLTLLALFFFATLCGSIAQFLRIPGYVKEKHVQQSLIYIAHRLLYLVALILLLLQYDRGVDSVGLAAVLSSVMFVILMQRSLTTILPPRSLLGFTKLIRLTSSLARRAAIVAVAYAGLFLSGSSMLLIAKTLGSNSSVIEALALAVTVSAIMVQLLTSFAYIAVPKMLEYINNQDLSAAFSTLKKTNIIIFKLSVVFSFLIVLYGDWVLRLWLGVPISQYSVRVVAVGCLAQATTVFGIQWMQLLIARQQIKAYAFANLIEGMAVALLSWVVFYFNLDAHLMYIVGLPLVVYWLKTKYIRELISDIKMLGYASEFKGASTFAGILAAVFLTYYSSSTFGNAAALFAAMLLSIGFAYHLLLDVKRSI